MKRIFMILAICVGVNAVSMAQESANKGGHRNLTPEQRAEKQTNKMQETLSLSEAQKKAVYDLNLQSARDMQAIREDTKDVNKEKFKVIRAKKNEKLKSILSAEQLAKYETLKAERKNRMKNKSGKGQTEYKQDK